MNKKYCVWYQSGAGGYLVAWLLQVALNPDQLHAALAVFPSEIVKDYSQWRSWEAIPPDVGLLCNVFYPAPGYEVAKDDLTRQVLEQLSIGPDSFWTLAHCRIKYFLVNYVYEKGYCPAPRFAHLKQDPAHYRLDDQQYVKQQSDLLFDLDKNIFIVAPRKYVELSCLLKNGTPFQPANLDRILTEEFTHLKTFDVSSIWQDRWVEEIEKNINQSVDDAAQNACAHLLDRYWSVTPPAIREFCGKN